jgi:rhamnosyltransferase
LLQEVGHGRAIHLPFGKQISIGNHPPLRLYYISRNFLYIGKRHHQFMHWAIEVFKRMLIVLFFETNRREKIRFMLTGIRHYKAGIMGKSKICE